jgi:repressor LexA
MVKGISQKQERMLQFIGQFIEENGYPPTVRQIQAAMSISSTSVVDYHLNVLERTGWLRRDAETSRGMELLDETGKKLRQLVVGVPIMGRIAAGEPIEAVAEPETLNLTKDLVAGAEAYALRVKGRSMIEDCIDDGDLVIVRPQDDASDGETVVALLLGGPTEAGEVTLKRFYREKDRIRLQPRNPNMQPIYVAPNMVRVQGKVIAVIRKVGNA